jgi:phosphate-selective porin OprO and OprP
MKNMKNLFLICLLGLFTASVFGQTRNVTGVVTSNIDGKPIAEVTVRIKGAITAVFTDTEGRYQVEIPAGSIEILTFSHPDFDYSEVALDGKDKLDVMLTSNQRFNQYGVPVSRRPLDSEERDGIIVFESADQDYRFWFDMRVQVDGAVFWGEKFNQIGNGLEVRRARLAIKAELPGNWEAELDMDFADALADLKDAYLKYKFNDNGWIRVGNFKERFSMETNTTSRYLTFMERPIGTRVLTPSRHLGIQALYSYSGFIAAGGVHFQDVGDFEVVQNRKDNNLSGRNEGYSFTGKLTAMPFYKDVTKGLHFAVAGSYRTPKLHDDIDRIRFDTRSYPNVNRIKYLDTDRFDAKDYSLANFEMAGYYQGFRLQSEYTLAKVNRLTVPGVENFYGFYVMGSYMLFGGNHLYNTKEGEFTQAMPGRSWGDFEIGFRYEYLNLNSRPKEEGGIMAGSGEAYTLALNYYAKSNVKLAINYRFVNHDRYANGRGRIFVGTDADGRLTRDPRLVTEPAGKGGDSYHGLGFRVEVAF